MRTVLVGANRYRHEADFARELLESAGIPSVLAGDDAGGMRPEIISVNPMRLYVTESDAGRAPDVLAFADEEHRVSGEREPGP